MANKLSSNKLFKLKIRKDQIQARIVNTENRLKHNKSKQETRKKVLVGSYFKRKYALDGEWLELMKLIDPYIVRPYERSLFGLPEVLGDAIDETQLCSDLDLSLKGTILIGAYFMGKYKEDPEGLLKLIDPFLHRPIDRKLFGLDDNQKAKESIPF